MAQIVINEISQNYTYNIGSNSYACVALPITSCWGDGYFDPDAEGITADEMLERTTWRRFPATQAGLESFVSTFRGPAANYRLAKDNSYQIAMTLITAGYDVLVCRVCPGTKAQNMFKKDGTSESNAVIVKAKYPGSFGNALQIELKKLRYVAAGAPKYYWNLITYIVDSTGIKTAVENKTFVFELNNSTDNILHWSEVESDFITLSVVGTILDDVSTVFSATASDTSWAVVLTGGSDKAADPDNDPVVTDITVVPSSTVKSAPGYRAYSADTDAGKTRYKYENSTYTIDAEGAYVVSTFRLAATGDTTKYAINATTKAYEVDAEGTYAEYPVTSQLLDDAYELAKARYVGAKVATEETFASSAYGAALSSLAGSEDVAKMSTVKYMEWVYTAVAGTSTADGIYSLLKDRLTYNPNRLISPWDDQDTNGLTEGEAPVAITALSPLHVVLMDTAYGSRCATAYIDIPKSVPRSDVWDDSVSDPGYAQKLARYLPSTSAADVNSVLFSSHSALFAPWGQYQYVGTSRQTDASPAFQALMIQRAQILNQALQYEWALPTNRKHNLKLGKLAYNVPKKLLDKWQTLEGVGVNVITAIPDLGTNIWGNSTLFEVPPATYQALANMSTRFLVNAVEDVAYRVGISITFQYNNDQAYNKFYAGVTPILDTMKNVGAIEDYYVTMSADISGLDQVNANTVIGKIYLVVNGVVNDIYIDLVALPASVSLDQFRS